MENIKNRSLAELEELYQKQLQHWKCRREEAFQQLQAAEQQMAVYDRKLRYIRELANGPEAAAAPVKVAQATITI